MLIRRVILEQVYFTAVQALPLIIPVALIFGKHAYYYSFSRVFESV